MFNIYIYIYIYIYIEETGPLNLAVGLVTDTVPYNLQYLSVFHCIDIGVFINEEQWTVIVSVKQKSKSTMVILRLFKSFKLLNVNVRKCKCYIVIFLSAIIAQPYSRVKSGKLENYNNFHNSSGQ